MLIGGDDISNDVITLGTCFPDRTWIWKCCYLRREENRSSRIKTSRSKGENQKQPQPTYCVNAGTRTQTTVVGGGCSHHCATFKNLLPCLRSLRSRRLKVFWWKKERVSERERHARGHVSPSRAPLFLAPTTSKRLLRRLLLTLTLCLFILKKLLLHLNQVSTSHPKERFDLYHKLQNLFDKWMFHLRYVDVHVTYCRCSVQLMINEFPMINRTTNASDTPLFGLKDQKTIRARFGPESTVKPFLWDTFIQGTKSLVPEKCSHNLCICYLYWGDTSIQGKRTLLSPLNLH